MDAYAYFSDVQQLWHCGHDFMAGTICSLEPDHEGPHAPICQVCGVDWYLHAGCLCDEDLPDE